MVRKSRRQIAGKRNGAKRSTNNGNMCGPYEGALEGSFLISGVLKRKRPLQKPHLFEAEISLSEAEFDRMQTVGETYERSWRDLSNSGRRVRVFRLKEK